MGQFILMLAHCCLAFVCACGGTICCPFRCPVSSSRSQENQSPLEARMNRDWEKILLSIFSAEARFKAVSITGTADCWGQNFSLGKCLRYSWRAFSFWLELWSIWLAHRETWLCSTCYNQMFWKNIPKTPLVMRTVPHVAVLTSTMMLSLRLKHPTLPGS